MIAKFFSIVLRWLILRRDGDMEDIVWIDLIEDLGDLGGLNFDFDFIGDDGGDVATNRDDV